MRFSPVHNHREDEHCKTCKKPLAIRETVVVEDDGSEIKLPYHCIDCGISLIKEEIEEYNDLIKHLIKQKEGR